MKAEADVARKAIGQRRMISKKKEAVAEVMPKE